MRPIEDEMLKSLGQISINIAKLHGYVSDLAARIVGQRGRAFILSDALWATTSLRQTTDICEAMFRRLATNRQFVTRLDDIMKRVRTAEAQRNLFVHSRWLTVDEKEEHAVLTKGRRSHELGIEYTLNTFNLEDFESLAKELQDIIYEIISFIGDVSQGGDFAGEAPHSA